MSVPTSTSWSLWVLVGPHPDGPVLGWRRLVRLVVVEVKGELRVSGTPPFPAGTLGLGTSGRRVSSAPDSGLCRWSVGASLTSVPSPHPLRCVHPSGGIP